MAPTAKRCLVGLEHQSLASDCPRGSIRGPTLTQPAPYLAATEVQVRNSRRRVNRLQPPKLRRRASRLMPVSKVVMDLTLLILNLQASISMPKKFPLDWICRLADLVMRGLPQSESNASPKSSSFRPTLGAYLPI